MNTTRDFQSISAVLNHPLAKVTVKGVVGQVDIGLTGCSLGIASGGAGFTGDNRLFVHLQWCEDYLNGNERVFRFESLLFPPQTPFQCAVVAAAAAIPRATTLTYADLAKNAGFPGAARAAASVMRKNLFPLWIPCHRVVASGGGIGGYLSCSEGWPVELKRTLLHMEAC